MTTTTDNDNNTTEAAADEAARWDDTINDAIGGLFEFVCRELERAAARDPRKPMFDKAEREGIDCIGWHSEYADDEWLFRAPGWIASYGDGADQIVFPCAETAREAAQEYVYSDLDDVRATEYRDVRVWRAFYDGSGLHIEDETTVTVRIDPDEPGCIDGHDHDYEWRSPQAARGGHHENQGAWKRGEEVVMRDVCLRCGVYRVTDISRYHGEGYSYKDAVADPLAWVSSLTAPAGAKE